MKESTGNSTYATEYNYYSTVITETTCNITLETPNDDVRTTCICPLSGGVRRIEVLPNEVRLTEKVNAEMKFVRCKEN